MKKHIFVLLVPLLLLAGCWKEEPDVSSTVNGRLVEFGNTQQSIPNIPVALLKRVKQNCFFCAEQYDLLEWATSDANGHFNFTFLDTTGSYYLAIRPRDKKYYQIDLFELKEDKQTQLHGNSNLVVEVVPQAFIRFRIKNVNPFNQYDLLQLQDIDEYWRYKFKGMSVDTTVVATARGNTTFQMTNVFYKNAIQTVLRDSVKTIGHDTINVKIFY
jgi:hypothetical protein